MSREIKFRFWNKIAHKFQSPSKYAIDGNGDLVAYDYEMGAYDDPTPFSRTCIIAQQYTGLKDKNGKEIYEGDIVKFYPWKSPKASLENYLCKSLKQILWGTNHGQFPNVGWVAISLSPADLEEGHSLNIMDARNMEVVGNIFENKDLLEKEL